MGTLRHFWIRSTVIKRWRDAPRTIACLEKIVVSLASGEEIRAAFVCDDAARAAQRRLMLNRPRVLEGVPLPPKRLGRRANPWLTGGLKDPSLLSALFPGDAVWNDEFCFYGALQEFSASQAFFRDAMETTAGASWAVSQEVGDHDWELLVPAEMEQATADELVRNAFAAVGATATLATDTNLGIRSRDPHAR